MAETSDQMPPRRLAGDPDEPPAPTDSSGQSSEFIDRHSPALEATELARLRRNYSRASSYHQPGTTSTTKKPTTVPERFIYSIKKFWRHQISINVEHSTCRDHLALERTFLAYLRTSLALSMIGIAVAQLFRLQHAPNPSPTFGFYVLGKPMACICQGAAIYVLAIGAFRTWRSQNAMVRGKAISGGFEIVFLAAGVFLIVLVFFVLLISVDVEKEDV